MRPGYFGECVWSPPGERTEMIAESKGLEYEAKFMRILCDDLCKILGVRWQDQRIVSKVLEFALNDKIRTLLDQYLNSQLEIVARSIKHDFNLKGEVKINHEYAVHARFDSIIEVIKNIYARPVREPEEGAKK